MKYNCWEAIYNSRKRKYDFRLYNTTFKKVKDTFVISKYVACYYFPRGEDTEISNEKNRENMLKLMKKKMLKDKNDLEDRIMAVEVDYIFTTKYSRGYAGGEE